MNLRKAFFCLAVVMSVPTILTAQEQRPALVPLAQGGGSASTSSSSGPGMVGNLSEGPITPGEVVHISVFDAPDFSLITRVSESGDVPFPILGAFHIGGLNSAEASSRLSKELKDRNLMLNPEVTVTVESANTGITVLGEVHSPGIYRWLVGSKRREMKRAAKLATSDEERRAVIARLYRQKLN